MAKQLQLQRLIERALDNFKKAGKNNWTPARVRSRMQSLKENWGLFLDGHSTLVRTVTDAIKQSSEYFKDDHFEATEDIYQSTLDYMAECLEALDPNVSSLRGRDSESLRANASAFSLSHLPPIRLPPFDGTYDTWEQFRDRFTALIIQNNELTDFARMHFLTSCVQGRALDCIRNLPVTADNFEVAWQALIARYENKRRLLNLHLSTLLNLPVVSRESVGDLHSLRDQVNIAVASLASLQRTPKDLWNDVLVHIVVQKLDPVTRKAWNLKSSDNDEPPSFDDLTRFLSTRTRALEECSVGAGGKSPSKPMPVPRVIVTTASASASATSQSLCPVCKARHYFSACPSFVRSPPSQRRDLVKQHKRCYNCLSKSHSVHDCKSRYSCRICQQRHHTMLHTGSDSRATPAVAPSPTRREPPPDEPPSAVQSLLSSVQSPAPTPVLLATARVTVSVASGRSVKVRALLDQGSEMTFISENLAQLLRAQRIRMPTSVSAVGCVHAGTFQHATRISISPNHARSPSLSTTALILKNLTSYAPPRVADVSAFSHLSELQWADSDPTGSDPIDILIGADVYSDVILRGLRKGGTGRLIAPRSIFGWVLSGPVDSASLTSRSSLRETNTEFHACHVTAHQCAVSSSLDEELKKFWEIEELPRQSMLTAEDKRCEEYFRTTHCRGDDGRYIVRLPFKGDTPIDIGDSRGRAETLLISLMRRLRANPERSAEYGEFLSEYESLGHMRESSGTGQSREQHVFIPHHPVVREDSATTHLRVVFNASSPTTNGTSLNDHLMAGPKLQTDLPAVILRWRHFQFVCVADIAKMYRQIQIDARDINYQRILWQRFATDSVREFQLLTVTYGMSCAPYLALRVIQQLASDEGSNFPLAAPILRENIYVDDVLFGGNNITQLLQTRNQLIALLRSGGFELRKWASNSALILSDIDAADHGLACNKTLATDEQLRIPGIGWNPSFDVFHISVSLAHSIPQAKCSILSAIAKLYDPLGWVTPVIIAAKIFMQHLWREKLGWDESVPDRLLSRWQQMYSRLSDLNGLQLSRWTGLGDDDLIAELHGFADASNVAYSAVIYLKVTSRSGKVTITLIAGKSRVAPLTPLSIPRLELSAAVLLARLFNFVRGSVKADSSSCFCWTDSTIVLAWLKQHPSRWKTFVANRVADVHSRLPNVEWRHVPTGDNPADCASRGLLADELLVRPLWWQGPSWLRHSRDQWPEDRSCLPVDAALEEKVISLHLSRPPAPLDLASRFSSWPKLIRITAYIFKFALLCRRVEGDLQATESSGLALTAAECSRAKMWWIKRTQAELFPIELHALSTDHALSATSPFLSLRPFLDRDGILRVGGRLRESPLPYATRHPILLASHPLVNLIVDQAHKRALHAGVQLTLSTLRGDYWIIRARSIVKAMIHRCITCTRERAVIPSQLMGDLPAVRVSAPKRSFLHCGLDYAGPVQVRASAGRGTNHENHMSRSSFAWRHEPFT